MAGSARPLLLFAMPQEQKPFLDRCRATGLGVQSRAGRIRLLRDGFECATTALTGVGPLSSADALGSFRGAEVSEVVHAGFAASVTDDVGLGSIQRLGRVVGPDGGVVGAMSGGVIGGALPSLPEASIVSLSGPADVQMKQAVAAEGTADLIDMESWTVAAWCVERSIPYVGLRVVTDRRDDEIPAALMKAWDGRRFRLGGLVARAVFNGPLRRRLRELGRASDRAAAALAELLVQALSASAVD